IESNLRLDTSGSFPALSVTYGTWYWINIAYSYLLLLLGAVLICMLIQTLMRSADLYRGQASALLIADDHELARAGLRTMLTGQRGLELVGEATNGHEALALCRRLQPDLALIDVRMPELDGLSTCRSIKQECPGTSVILITVYEKSEYLIEALKAGAAGFV